MKKATQEDLFLSYVKVSMNYFLKLLKQTSTTLYHGSVVLNGKCLGVFNTPSVVTESSSWTS